MMTNEEKEAFYEECGRILGVDHNFVKPHYRLTRWNNRAPGNGRFAGHGVIRLYGATHIHIMLHTPALECTVGSIDEAYEKLKTIMGDDTVLANQD